MDSKDVYALSDENLVKTLAGLFKQVPTALEDAWERKFVDGIRETYIEIGRLTWKQRRMARSILRRFIERTNRRIALDS